MTMPGKIRTWPSAAAGLVALAVLAGCGSEPSVASRSAAAFREAQEKGQTPAGGHDHGGHGATASGGGHEHGEHGTTDAPDASAAAAGHQDHSGGGHANHGGGAADHSTMDHGSGHSVQEHTAPQHGGHEGHGKAAPDAEQAGSTGHTGHSGHEGHAAAAPVQPDQTQPPAQDDHSGHAGHAPSPAGQSTGSTPSAPEPVAVPAGQPAKTLSPDPLDSPADTSVTDAQRSAEMAQGMSGGHGEHGGHGGHGATGTYRHVDVGRGPGAHEGSESQTPGAEPHHQHGAEGAEEGAEETAAVVYACPMHPEVTSNEPGTCSKCGMALVERREE